MSNKTKERYRPRAIELIMLGAVCILGAGLILGKDKYFGASYILGDPDRNGIIDKGVYNPLTRNTVVLFGVQENDSVRYIRADEMQRRYSPFTHIDYIGIKNSLKN